MDSDELLKRVRHLKLRWLDSTPTTRKRLMRLSADGRPVRGVSPATRNRWARAYLRHRCIDYDGSDYDTATSGLPPEAYRSLHQQIDRMIRKRFPGLVNDGSISGDCGVPDLVSDDYKPTAQPDGFNRPRIVTPAALDETTGADHDETTGADDDRTIDDYYGDSAGAPEARTEAQRQGEKYPPCPDCGGKVFPFTGLRSAAAGVTSILSRNDTMLRCETCGSLFRTLDERSLRGAQRKRRFRR